MIRKPEHFATASFWAIDRAKATGHRGYPVAFLLGIQQ